MLCCIVVLAFVKPVSIRATVTGPYWLEWVSTGLSGISRHSGPVFTPLAVSTAAPRTPISQRRGYWETSPHSTSQTGNDTLVRESLKPFTYRALSTQVDTIATPSQCPRPRCAMHHQRHAQKQARTHFPNKAAPYSTQAKQPTQAPLNRISPTAPADRRYTANSRPSPPSQAWGKKNRQQSSPCLGKTPSKQ